MKRLLLQGALLALAAIAHCAEPARLLPKTKAFPLALDDSIQFRKSTHFLNDLRIWKPVTEDMIAFERLRMNYGAVNFTDRIQRAGDFYTFHWRANRPANLKFRFEYCQEKLGAFVQAQERTYDGAKGSIQSDFAVTGDAYLTEGRVTSWRAILIENGKIVALNQSFLWR